MAPPAEYFQGPQLPSISTQVMEEPEPKQQTTH